MTYPVNSNTPTLPRLAAPSGPSSNEPGAFSGALAGAIGEVEQSQQAAQTAVQAFLRDGQGDVHSVALATQRAELTLELFQQVRNKIVSAYQEIMKTQI